MNKLSYEDNVKMFKWILNSTANDYRSEGEDFLYLDDEWYKQYDGVKFDIDDATTIVDKKDTSTIKELLYFYQGHNVAILDFADGLTPGGEVMKGATTQEEQLCRRSNLYRYLENGYKYYDVNRKCSETRKCTDGILYCKDVWFMFDDDYNPIINNMVFCDVITCPAPIKGYATDDEIRQRMKKILLAAYSGNADVLIAGAWGCGAFGNNYKHFRNLWEEVIYNTPILDMVVFPTI